MFVVQGTLRNLSKAGRIIPFQGDPVCDLQVLYFVSEILVL